MSLALRTDRVSKRYGQTWALRDCTIEIPAGSVTALLGPNGAGKSTLLSLAVGLSAPTDGQVQTLGHDPVTDARQLLPHLGFVAQEHPLHQRFTIGDTLQLGRRLNPDWNHQLALARLEQLRIPLSRQVGSLSGGQQAQVALTLALAKRPQLLLLDEPAAALDPRARREFLNIVLETVVDCEMTVVLSSHIVGDLERVCDQVIILSDSEVVLFGSIEDVVDRHRVLTGPRTDAATVSRVHHVVRESHTARQTTLLVKANGHVYDARWTVRDVDFEEIVLAYLGYGTDDRGHTSDEAD